jgi:hypothetical protein
MSQLFYWSNVRMVSCLLVSCFSGKKSYGLDVLWANAHLGKWANEQMSFWANVVWAKVVWANVFLGKCLFGQTSYGQMSFK